MRSLLMLAPLLLLAAACSSSTTAERADSDKAQVEERPIDALQGSWIGSWLMRDGSGQPISATPYEVKIEIAGDRFWIYAPEQPPMELQMKLSPNFDLPFIDLSDPKEPSEPLLGVYARDGGALLICSGKERPTSVVPCDGPSQWLLTLSSAEVNTPVPIAVPADEAQP